MTSTEMLARLRTLLDEVSESYWTDTESYAALADGQNRVVDEILKVYKIRYLADQDTPIPEELRVLENYATAGVANSYASIPANFLWLLNASWDHNASGGEIPCAIMDQNRQFNHHQANTFLTAAENSPVAWVGPNATNAQSINFLPAVSGSGTYKIYYLAYPTAITSEQNPSLPISTHDACVFYAAYKLLTKDQRPEEASLHLQNFYTQIKTIVGV